MLTDLKGSVRTPMAVCVKRQILMLAIKLPRPKARVLLFCKVVTSQLKNVLKTLFNLQTNKD